jgi:hypothetical protein
MDKNKKIDDLFREKLGNYKPEFIQEHWQSMKPVIENSMIYTMITLMPSVKKKVHLLK